MSPEIKRILYATDLSENARYAFAYAADLAQKYNANLTILSVLESISKFTDIRIQEMIGEEKWKTLKSIHSQSSKEKIRSRIEEICREMDKSVDSCTLMADDIRISNGTPHLEILKTADTVNADIIVIGTYGHNIVQDSLIGGTARRIVKDSKVPVMVVRLPEN